MKLATLLAFATTTWFGGALSASADSRLLVLSTHAPEVDATILGAARTDSRFHVMDRAIRVETAQRDARCSGLDDGCLARIAARRGVDRILYATLAPATEDPEQMHVTLRVFDRYTGRTRETTVGTIEADSVDDASELEPVMSVLVASVLAVPEEGAARIRALAGSRIELDGQPLGVVPENGEIELQPLRVGRRLLRVASPSGAVWESPIVVRARETIRVTVGAGNSVLDSIGESHARRDAGRADGMIDPPPEWVLTIPGDPPPLDVTDPFRVGEGLRRVRLTIPILEDHVHRGEIRTTTNARVGFLPNVSSTGVRMTTKLRF